MEEKINEVKKKSKKDVAYSIKQQIEIKKAQITGLCRQEIKVLMEIKAIMNQVTQDCR